VIVPWCGVLLSLTGIISPEQGPVETLMRRVDFHVDSTIVMHIQSLRGRLVPRRAGQAPSFDDPLSFDLEMDSATITLTTTALADLLNRYVFNYRGAPLRSLKLVIDHGRLKQSGSLHGLHFSVTSEPQVTPAGELLLHPKSIHVFGIAAGGLMKLFGLSLEKLADVHRASGVRILGNDLLLTPAMMLPPPRTRGKLAAITLGDSTITLRFRRTGPVEALAAPDPRVTSFMYFKGATLRFWTLTMQPADLFVVDHDPRDPFDFWLARYRRQLMAGFSKNTASGGLITEWPDLGKTMRGKP
jgi:hypothetical protein